ncbi:hypothetical protein BDV97DRAFT_365263 [Delphinella strobiligena]|nr:hypothetical protein BDV97DRAFT_365263 [Delphinella strobiligena]
MLHTGSVVPMSSDLYQSPFHQRKTSKTPSVSASSVSTTNRAAPPTINYTPVTASELPVTFSEPQFGLPKGSDGGDPSSTVRFTEPQFDPQSDDGVANLNRWSQSTASSAGNLESPRKRRTTSGSNTPPVWIRPKPSASRPESPRDQEELSPRSTFKPLRQRESTPIKQKDHHRRNGPSPDKLLLPAMPPLPSLDIPSTKVVSPTDTDVVFSANPFTPSTAGLLTPLSYSNLDYFGSGTTGGGGSTSAKHAHRSSSAKQTSQHLHSPDYDDGSPGADRLRRSKNRENREKDKKAMLSKALEKANTAVLLDNAMNYDAALDAYQDACKLLEYVMDRTSGSDDRRKLESIRETYTMRVDELLQLQPIMQPASEDKSLPPRPASNESIEFGMAVHLEEAMSPTDRDSTVIGTATLTRIVDAPKRPSYMPRNSFLSDAIREVEGSSPEAFLGPLWERERSRSPYRESMLTVNTASAPGQDNQMPSPLTPRRSPSYASQEDQTSEGVIAELPGDMSQNEESVSWLDTIDESGSDTSSMHSRSSRHGLQRRDISGPIGDDALDFDAAFDAAVEAAYEDGYVPDRDAAHASRQSTYHNPDVALSHRSDPIDFLNDTEYDLDEEAEEERMLDDITRDYIDHGFDFGMQSESALPRQSDSSLLSRNTWQSSVVSNRTTAGTSLSTVAKDVIPETPLDEPIPVPSVRDKRESVLVLPEFVIAQSSPRPLSVISEGSRSVQDRRSTGPNFKQLKIETARKSLLVAVDDETAKNDGEEGADEERGRPISEVPSLRGIDRPLKSANPLYSVREYTDSADSTSGIRSPRPRLFRKNKSSASLRDHSTLISEEPSETLPNTPLSASFFPSSMRDDNGPPTSRRPHIIPSGGSYSALRDGAFSTATLFDTSLSAPKSPSSPTLDFDSPSPLESCPESSLLRPFWLLRCIASTIIHPRGGYLTNRLFVPREVWQTRNVKLKNLDDKIANCDLLTAALGKLSTVDTYDADAVLEELQSFEEIMERVQAVMAKKLGQSEVGVQGIGLLFRDAAPTESGAVPTEASKDPPKTNSGKSYLSSWRKLRSKNSGVNSATGGSFGVRSEKEGVTMASIPMTSFVPVENRSAYQRELPQDSAFDGPLKEYMGCLARLCEAAQVLDQVARQVEDPGLKHSSPTHIGLELSTRHAAEFFGFYICRFALTDIGILLDKFVKRNTEWVLL